MKSDVGIFSSICHVRSWLGEKQTASRGICQLNWWFSDYRSPVAPRFVTCICHGNGSLGMQTRGAFACLERQRVCDWKQSWTSGRCIRCEVRNQMSSEWIRYWNSTQHCGTLSSCRTGSIANVCNWTLPAFRRFDWKIKKQFKIKIKSSYHFVSWHVLFRTHEASDESLAALSNELLDTKVWDWQIVKGACSGVGQCPVHFAILASLDLETTLIDNDCIKKNVHSLVIRSTALLQYLKSQHTLVKNLVQFRCNSVLFPISGLRCTLGTRSCARPARRL